MARPFKHDYTKVASDYQTGLYSIPELAKKYKIKRTTLIMHLKNNGIEVNDSLKTALTSIDKGLEIMNNEIKEKIIDKNDYDKERLSSIRAIESGLRYLEMKHGTLAREAVNIVEKSFKKTNDLLDNSCYSASEFKDIMAGFKMASETIGLFPKQPLVAIQNNLNSNNNNKTINNKKDFNVNINFVNAKENKIHSNKINNDDIIEVESKDIKE